VAAGIGDDVVENDNIDDFDFLLQTAARVLCKSSDPKAFLDWIAMAGPSIAPRLANTVDPRTGPIGDAFRTFGVPIYNRMPLPEFGFRPSPLPKPGRNDPCLCGSGHKYKQCCQPMADVMKFEDANFLQYVLRVIPRKRYADLPDSRVDPAAVAHVAMEWNHNGDAKEVTALLEPWFAKGRPLGDKHGLMFDMLMDAYLQLGQERKRESLLERMMSNGNRALRAVALQRRATMLTDRGQVNEAWRVFLEAQRENPDDPAIGLLEVTLLVSRGDIQQARDRARFWVMRMERERDPDLRPAIEFMRQVVNDPGAALASASRAQYPEVDRLMRLFNEAPVPQAHYDILSEDDDAMLSPRVAVHALEKAWRNVYPQEKPALVMTQLGCDAMWDDAGPWLEFLASSPLAWHSFDVMDDLVMAVEAIAELGLDLALLEPMLARGRALLDINLQASGYEGELPWVAGPNRAALRILAHNVFRDCQAANRNPAARKRFLDNAKYLLQLNPADNHGGCERNCRVSCWRTARRKPRSSCVARIRMTCCAKPQ
jgi:tetratricopeptide (TPR) repeat protein